MTSKTPRRSTAEIIRSRESNLEANVPPQNNRLRFRQLRLTSSLLNRLASSGPKLPLTSSTQLSPHHISSPDPSPPSHPSRSCSLDQQSPSLNHDSSVEPFTSSPPNPLATPTPRSTLHTQHSFLDPAPITDHLCSTSDPSLAPGWPEPSSCSLLAASTSIASESSPWSLLASSTSSVSDSSSLALASQSSCPLLASSTSNLSDPLSCPPLASSTSILAQFSSCSLLASSTTKASETPTCSQPASTMSDSSELRSLLISCPPVTSSSSTGLRPTPSSNPLPVVSSNSPSMPPLLIPKHKSLHAAVKPLLGIRDVAYTWYPPRQVESLYADSIKRFEVLPSKVVKVGSRSIPEMRSAPH